MTTNKFIIGLFIIALIVSIAACGASDPADSAPVKQQPSANVEAPPAANEAEIEAKAEPLEASVEVTDKIEAEEPQVEAAVEPSEVEPDAGNLAEADTPVEVVAEDVEASAVTEDATNLEASAEDAETMINAEPVEFTATTGLNSFSTYRMNFMTDFDGTRNGQPTSGSMGGLFEATKNPEGQHWQVNMAGNAFSELAMLGGKMEMYNLGGTIYIQAPDGTWIGMPAMLVDSMLPTDMGNPEDSIELPVTAMRHPGEETVNDVVTHRYTFGPEDLAGDSATYEHVAGTIWVAVDGNYVVKYEAEVVGQHNLSAGGMDLLDDGAITMAYEVTDVNSDFTIAPPSGAQAVNLTDLLFQ